MRQYIIPFLAYILVIPVVEFFTGSIELAYAVRVLIMVILLAIFWKDYKLKWVFEPLAVITGIVIFVLWLSLETLYPFIFEISYNPANILSLISKLIGFVIIAPLIEELFTRDFLMRILIDKDWGKVQMGKFTWPSFVITVLFFGFSHNRWLSGITVGIILNLLIYKTKKIESCIMAHLIANLCLAIFIVVTSSWYLW